MASQSPAGAEVSERSAPYRAGWAEVSGLMDAGASWSGHERNCAYLNLGGGRFVDVSAAAGLDFLDDGRAVAAGDWDGDGAVDLWLKNRTGPQLRFARNQAGGRHHFVAFDLVGTRCNRDAVGARVEIRAGDERWTRELRAGEGYLAQSSARLTFALGARETIDGLTVHWPGGEPQRFGPLPADRAYRITQDTDEPLALPRRSVSLAPDAAPWPDRGAAARVVLRTPLPLPPELRAELYGPREPDRVRIVTLWAHWCAPCVVELEELARRSDELILVGADVLPVTVDAPEEVEAALALFQERVAPSMNDPGFEPVVPSPEAADVLQALLAHVVGRRERTALPATLLVDRRDMIQVVYLGPARVGDLLEDAHAFGPGATDGSVRGSFPGRWFFGVPRDLGGLAGDLRALGRDRGASFYGALHALQGRGVAR